MSLLLSVEDISVDFFTLAETVHAVDGLSFSVNSNETVAIVGESGCGKSTAALAVLRLIPDPPGEITSGCVNFEGTDLIGLKDEQMRKIRGNEIAMIFQDPMMALNPVYTIGRQISEVLRLHMGLSRAAALSEAVDLLNKVGVPAPEERVKQYPHNLSGGMRQRVMIAMALACRPKLLIADEPTTALDVTIQAQVLALINNLKDEFNMAVLLITHDLAVVAETAQRVIVMYAGRKVEEGPVRTVFENPQHPYTRGLMKITRWDSVDDGYLPEIPGTVPSSDNMPQGCSFAPRCNKAIAKCKHENPMLQPMVPEHAVACFVAQEKK
jgi:peptide/nickel transport system ATP-binding protein